MPEQDGIVNPHDPRARPIPAELSAIRHGESMANAAFAAAAAAGHADTGLTGPDADIPLSPLGRHQAQRIGAWLAALPAGRRPHVMYVSPYLRTRQTADLALAVLPEADRPRVVLDDRLRDREAGVLELLTPAAIEARFPEEVQRRRREGELHYRPPGGESMADVAARVSAAVTDIAHRHAGARVLLVTHDAVVVTLRCVLEGLALEKALAEGPVLNASLTRWVARPDGLRLATYNQPIATPVSRDPPEESCDAPDG